MSQAEKPTEKVPFDVLVCEKVKETFKNIFAAHPEVRSLVCIVDWHGALNDAQINHGVWLSESGVVVAPDAIHGSLIQTTRMLYNQVERAIELNHHLRTQAEELAKQVVQHSEQLQKQQGKPS